MTPHLNSPASLSRRRLLRLAAAVATAGIATTLASCGGQAPVSSATGAASAAPPASTPAASTPAKPVASAPPPAASASSPASAKPAAGPASGSPSAAAAASAGQLKIGWLSPTTGPFASQGEPMSAGFKMYWDQVGNKAGGRDVRIIEEDETADPKNALDKARKLIEQDGVDVLGGIYSSASLYAIRDYVENSPRKLMVVVSNAGGIELDTSRKSNYFVRVAYSNKQSNKPLGTYAATKLGLKKAFVSASDFAAGHETSDAFKEGFTKAGGQIAGEQYPPLGNNDFAAYFPKISATDADCVYLFYGGNDAVRFVQQAAQFGVSKKVKMLAVGGVMDQTLLPAMGDSALGYQSAYFYYETLTTPENKQLADQYKAKTGKDINPLTVNGYDAAHLIADSLNASRGNPDPAQLLKAMQGHELKSARGPMMISPEFNDVVQNIYIAEVQKVDGKLVNVVKDTLPAQSPV